MEKIKARFVESENANRQQFEYFAKKYKDSDYMSNLLIAKMRFFHYKEMLKLFALNYKSPQFEGSKNSLIALLVAPSFLALAFNIVSPYSILRNIVMVSSFVGPSISFVLNLKDELNYIGET